MILRSLFLSQHEAIELVVQGRAFSSLHKDEMRFSDVQHTPYACSFRTKAISNLCSQLIDAEIVDIC